MRYRQLAAISGLAVVALAVAIGAYLVGADRGRGGDDRALVLARGAAVYAEACAACHGENLEGQPDWRQRGPEGRLPAPPHDENGHTWHHADELLFRIVKEGTAAVVGGGYESDMPAFGDSYSDDDIRAVLAWIKAQWPEEMREFQAEMSARDGGQP